MSVTCQSLGFTTLAVVPRDGVAEKHYSSPSNGPEEDRIYSFVMQETVEGEAGLLAAKMQDFANGAQIQAGPVGLGVSLDGPYGKLLNLIASALQDKQISAAEGAGIALEAAHVSGAEDKIKNLVNSLFSKLTGK